MARRPGREERTHTRRRILEAAAGVVAGGVVLDAAKALGGQSETAEPRSKQRTQSLVLYQSGETWEEVSGEDGTGTGLADVGLIGKGLSRVEFQGKAFSVQREGLYRFMSLPESVRNLISLRDERSLVPRILVDADMGLLFKTGGAFLGAEEMVNMVRRDHRPEFFSLGQKAAVLDPFFLRSDGYNYALEFRWRWGTPEGQWRWYRRVMQRIR